MLQYNPAADLARAHIAKTHRELPYQKFPIIARPMHPDELDDLCEKVPHFNVYAPYFLNINYIGSNLADGINLVRGFLIDELEVYPRSDIDITLKDHTPMPNERVIMVNLDT